jgi:hypothetical protein
MNCCPSADITFSETGILASEKNIQADGTTLQFFPFRTIQTVRYSHSRGEGGILSLWISGTGTPGAGGLAYRYAFPCGQTGKEIFERLIGLIP